MNASKYMPIATALLLALASGGPALAETPNFPWVEIESTSVNAGIGGQSGDGVLRLPNLGTNCMDSFTVSGFGAGIHVGISKVSASGGVANMTRVSDLSGDYNATDGEATLLAGGGAISMKNRNNGVTIDLKSQTEGIGIGFGGGGMSIRLAEPVINAPKAYVLQFGFNKTWVNAQNRAVLDQVIRAWKCRYANIWLFGHTDTTGKEDANLQLSEQRADAARDYLVGAGIVPTRVMIQAKGENSPLVATANNVRLRSNRAVVVVIQE
jgi:outer membrane protein OmpA-like peptidoglycan-associated protein